MILLLSLFVLGSALSLVIFHLDLSWDNLSSRNRNEVVFGERNKLYGAYRIRTNYNDTLLISVVITLLGTAAVCLAPLLFNFSAPVTAVPIPSGGTEVHPYTDIPVVHPPAPKPPAGSTENSTPLVVTRNDSSETLPAAPPTTAGLPETGAGTGNAQETGGGSGTTPVIEPIPEPTAFPDVAPEFEGGEAALLRYLAENLRYPEFESSNGIEGVVYVTFVIDGNGYVRDVRELKGVKGGTGLTREAIRVVRTLPRWKPGRMGVHPVPVQFNLPVRFIIR